MNACADFEQAQQEQSHMEQIVAALQRVENWQHTREDVLFIASELGLLTIYQPDGDNHEQK